MAGGLGENKVSCFNLKSIWVESNYPLTIQITLSLIVEYFHLVIFAYWFLPWFGPDGRLDLVTEKIATVPRNKYYVKSPIVNIYLGFL